MSHLSEPFLRRLRERLAAADLPPIPRHSEEAVQAEANAKWFGDTEKVPTTSLRGLTVRGVPLESRDHKAHEYETMRAMVLELPEQLVPLVLSLSCDSRACCVYTAFLKRCSKRSAYFIADVLECVALACEGGHNGIYVVTSEYEEIVPSLDPYWLGDYE